MISLILVLLICTAFLGLFGFASLLKDHSDDMPFVIPEDDPAVEQFHTGNLHTHW